MNHLPKTILFKHKGHKGFSQRTQFEIFIFVPFAISLCPLR